MFANIALNSVIDVRRPSAKVPPNEDRQNILNPKKSIMDVYIMLCPTSFKERITDEYILQLFAFSS